MATVYKPVPCTNVIDLPNGATIVVREVDDLFYLDAYGPNGGAVMLQLNDDTESVLRAVLDTRRARRAALGKATP